MAMLCIGSVSAAGTAIERTEQMSMPVDSWLIITSNRQTLQTVEVRGNMTAAELTTPASYPTDYFNFTSISPGPYEIYLSFNYSSDYNVTIATSSQSGNTGTGTAVEAPASIHGIITAVSPRPVEYATYYVSSGQLLLTIELDVNPQNAASEIPNRPPWESFMDWLARFGAAFPTWVKLIYLLLGVQFATIGYTWINYENRTRMESAPGSVFDFGNKFYIWCEIFQKYCLTAFLIIAVLMGGQYIVLYVLNFMFLLPVNMLSLWDLFVLCFAAGMAVIAWLSKLILKKTLDWEPTFEE
jgi:hypothetical protein